MDAEERGAYLAALRKALAPDGQLVIATFGPDAPSTCSGLPVQRYSPESLAAEMGDGFQLRESREETHLTPMGRLQRFQYSLLQRTG
jgi:hypothetical protein